MYLYNTQYLFVLQILVINYKILQKKFYQLNQILFFIKFLLNYF